MVVGAKPGEEAGAEAVAARAGAPARTDMAVL